MKLEDQVTSLELSKRLKELGVPQESYFWWIKICDSPSCPHDRDSNVYDYKKAEKIEPEHRWSAFTVAELGELLPGKIEKGDREYELIIETFGGSKWGLQYLDTSEPARYIVDSPMWFDDKNEANARAKLLIHLLENKLL